MEDIRRKVAVIGAGIVGVSTALWLARDGHEVLLVDKADPGDGTSYGNAGLLASAATLPVPMPGLLRKAPRMALDPREPLYLRWRHLPALMPWLIRYLGYASYEAAQTRATAIFPLIGDSLADHQALARGTAAENYIVPCDYVYGYAERSGYEADRFAWNLRRDQGFDVELLDRSGFQAYDPVYGEAIGCAAVMPNHGRITDPGRYVKELAASARSLGVRLLRGDVTEIAHANKRVTGVRMAGETVPCDTVVLSAGVWSKRLAENLGLKVPLHPESGFHMEFWGPSQMPRSPVMFAPGKCVITPMEGRIRMAGMVGYGGLDAPAPKAPYRMFLKHIKTALPNLTWKETKQWMGHRPSIVDSLPLIGQVPDLKGAYTGFGHDHVGLTGGPKTGQLLAQMITGKRPNIDMSPFDPGRFRR